MKILNTVFLSVIFCFFAMNAQERKNEYGAFSTLNLNLYSVDFQHLPNLPNCSPGFQDGSGLGASLGLFYARKLDNAFSVGLRGEYFNYRGKMTTDEPTTLILSQSLVPAVITHEITTNLATIGISPYLSYRLFAKVKVQIGLHAGYLITKHYDQKETTDLGAYTDGSGNYSGVHNAYSGNLSSVNNFNLIGNIGLTYDMVYWHDSTYFLSPMIEFSRNILPIFNNNDINKFDVSNIKLGVAFTYAPKQEVPKIKKDEYKEIIDTVKVIAERRLKDEIKRGTPSSSKVLSEDERYLYNTEIMKRTDTLFIAKKYKLDGTITAIGVDGAGNEMTNPVFTIEENIATKIQPLLNYVFFENNSAEIPNKYVKLSTRETSTFDIDKLHNGTSLSTYYQLLNIIGQRLKNSEKSKIRVVGCNSDLALEKGNKDLSRQRAESVANYLAETWGIDRSRLKLETRNLPARPSTPIDQAEKSQENSRVELYSENDEILNPIILSDTIRTANPPVARFKTNFSAEAGIASARIKAECINESSCMLLDTLIENSSMKQIDWHLSGTQKHPDKIIAYLTLTDSLGQEFKSKVDEMPVKFITIQKKRDEKLADTRIEKYDLLLFDFDKSEVKGASADLIKFIKSKLSAESIVTISGYTDYTGDETHNLNLSNKRAQNVKKALGVDAQIKAFGNTVAVGNDKSPEGRFYSRIVEITVETPINGAKILN